MNPPTTFLNPLSDNRWDTFVARDPRATIYHRSCWLRTLALTYNTEPFCVITEEPGTRQITGGVAFIPIKSVWLGNRLISLPLTSYCDALVDDPYLLPFAEHALTKQPGFDALELKLSRPIDPSALHDGSPWHSSTSFVTNVLNLDRPMDQLYDSLHHSCIRRKIRKAEKLGMRAALVTTDLGLKEFYALHAGVRKKHGLPLHPYHFFENMLHQLLADGCIYIPVVRYEGHIVAAATVLTSNSRHHLEYIACKQNCLSLGANQMLLWEIIKTAIRSGAHELDFGRSSVDNESLTIFKERWGAKSHPLYYYSYPTPQNSRVEDSGNAKRRFVTSLNRHLPSCILEWEGRMLYRHIG